MRYLFIFIISPKVIQKTQAGRAGISDVKTLIIKCTDFRTLRLTFIKGKVTTRADGQPILHTNADGNINESDDEEEEDAAEQKSISKIFHTPSYFG